MLARTFKFSLILFFALTFCSTSFSQEKKGNSIIVKEIKIIGNKTTQENILIREVPFSINDTINNTELTKKLERTKSNLLNTLLFNFVTVEPVYFDDEHISIYITVEERWYWWPMPIFEIEETNFNTWWLNKDFNKVNYGLFVAKENFRGRKETIMVKLQGGYTEQIGLKYIIPYVNKNKTNGLSVKFIYSRNHEITYGTTANKRDYYSSESNYVQKEINFNLGYELRPKLYNKHNFYLEFTKIDVADSVVLLNNDFLSSNKNSMQFLSFNYSIKRDKRNNRSYPTKGYYYDLSFYKDGLGIVNNTLKSFYLSSQIKKFWQLSDRFYVAGSLKSKITINDSPYYLYNGLGFRNNLVRGYEFYVINGENYGLMKSQIRYALLKNRIFNLKAIPANKFNKIPLEIYLGVFFDAGYVESKINSSTNFLTNSTLFGGGLGIDFVSYYDLVFRVEYAINGLNEKGLFLHFIAPI